MQELRTLADLLTRPDFLVGAMLGALALVLLYVLPPPWRVWGIPLTVATVIGIDLAVGRRLGMTIGVTLVVVGGALMVPRITDSVGWRSRFHPFGVILILAGSLLTSTRADLEGGMWIPWAIPLVVVAMGTAMGGWARMPSRLLGPMFLVSAFGIWTTVPETDTARVLLGVSLALAPATLSWIGAKSSVAGTFGVAAVVTWVGATSGDTRPASIVGAWGCLGLVALYPVLYDRLHHLPEWVIVVTHIVFVVISARIIGLGQEAGPAAIALTLMIGAVILLSRSGWVLTPGSTASGSD